MHLISLFWSHLQRACLSSEDSSFIVFETELNLREVLNCGLVILKTGHPDLQPLAQVTTALEEILVELSH